MTSRPAWAFEACMNIEGKEAGKSYTVELYVMVNSSKGKRKKIKLKIAKLHCILR